MVSLESSKQQYAGGLMMVGTPVPGHFDEVKVNDMPEHQETDQLLEKEFALDIVDGRHRRSCIQLLADSAEP